MKADIVSGFLGAGKTTFINNYLPLLGGKVALIENEFGDVSIDSDLIEGDIPMKEIFAGCICCTLRGDFASGIKELNESYSPDRIVVEPSGVGRLSDVVKGIQDGGKFADIDIDIERLIVLVDVDTFDDYKENFGPFYLDQIENANIIFLTYLDSMDKDEVERIGLEISKINPHALVYTSDYRDLDGDSLMDIIESADDPIISDEESTRSIPGDKVFSSINIDSDGLTEDKINDIFDQIESNDFGYILRAKGYIGEDGGKLIQYTPLKLSVEKYPKDMEGKIVIIGTDIKEEELRNLFV